MLILCDVNGGGPDGGERDLRGAPVEGAALDGGVLFSREGTSFSSLLSFSFSVFPPPGGFMCK